MAWNQNKWQKPQNNPVEKKTMSGVWKGAIAALVVIVGAVGAWLALSPAPATPAEKEPAVEKKKVKKPAPAAPKPKVEKEKKVVAPTPKVEAVEPPPKLPPGTVSIYTNYQGMEVRVAKDGTKTAMLPAWMKKRDEALKNPPRKVFKHSSESYLAMFLDPAVDVPPPPENYSKEKVLEMLIDPITIDEANDTEDEIRQKRGVMAMKEELKEYIKQGGTFDSYLGELQRRQANEAATMNDARRMITESMEKGDVEEAKKLYDAINKHFNEKGMPPVRVAPKYRRILQNQNQNK